MQQNGTLTAKRMPKYHFAVGLPNLVDSVAGRDGNTISEIGYHFGKQSVTTVLVWIVQNLYFQHCGNIMGPTGIAAGDGFQDGGVSLLDVRFCEDTLVVAKSFEEIGRVLEMVGGCPPTSCFCSANAGKKRRFNDAEPTSIRAQCPGR